MARRSNCCTNPIARQSFLPAKALRIALMLLAVRIVAVPVFGQTPRIVLDPIVSGLSTPVYFTSAKDGTNRRFIIEQPGRVVVMQSGTTSRSTFLDITNRVLFGGERGLLGLAFHPQFAMNRRFFLNYTRRPDGATVVAEYRASPGNPNVADTAETVLLVVPQPFQNHNGGMIEFGPDGKLYIGMGDGGSGNDPGNRAQNPQELLGKMLRLDVDVPQAQPSIFASGFRNPWRFSFDRLSGLLYLGDVGQNSREEVDIVINGGNYGWRVWEGTRCTNLGPAPCSAPGFIPPIIDYQNTGANGRCSIIGGYVYRGRQASLPYGAYVYGDLCSGEIFMLKDGIASVLLDTTQQISSFGEDESGEIYVVSIGGAISRIRNPGALTTSTRTFAVGAADAFVASSAGSAQSVTTGYGRVQADAARPLPSGVAIFGFSPRGVLVSEVGVPLSPLISAGRIFAEVSGVVNTGLALANPNDSAVTITFFFTDSSGRNYGNGTTSIPARHQLAAFLTEPPFNGTGLILGTFTFSSSLPVSAIALRGLTNERSEFLMTSLPVTDLNTIGNGPVTLPHFADGGGWKTQAVLLNPVDESTSGVVQFVDTAGAAVRTESFVIPPRSALGIQTEGTALSTQTGSVRISPASGSVVPSALSIFTYRSGGVTVTEAGVPPLLAGTAFEVYAELSGTIRTGVAIANPAPAPIQVALALDSRTAAIEIPPNGQRALFLNEVSAFASVTLPFQGVLALSSGAPFVVTSIRGRINERGDFLVTTTGAVDESRAIPSSEMLFPHFADGGNYDTQFILFGPATSGTMYLFDSSGQPAQTLFP